MSDLSKNSVPGVAAALGAFALWGLLPLYWKLLHMVSPFEILGHRILWSLLFIALLMQWTKRWGELRLALASRRVRITMCITSILVGGNWLLYIWAVNSGQILETSLGYYIAPLLSIFLGCVVLGERLSRAQQGALLLALCGVGVQLVSMGRLPWVALALAGSFSLYGLLRKTVPVESVPGIFCETAVLAPCTILYFISIGKGEGGFTGYGFEISLFLIGSGICTSVPLILFAFAARNINLSTLGVLQYCGPTIAFFIGVFVFDESLSYSRIVSFCFIWFAIVVYSVEQLWIRRALRRTRG